MISEIKEIIMIASPVFSAGIVVATMLVTQKQNKESITKLEASVSEVHRRIDDLDGTYVRDGVCKAVQKFMEAKIEVLEKK